MDYREILAASLRSPAEKLRDARLAGSVVGRTPDAGWQPEYQNEPGLEDVSPENWVPGPGTVKALALKAAAAAKTGLPMLAGVGMIRKGGNPDLVAIHQTSPRKLWPWTQNDRLPENLTAPSIAINNGKITQDFGDGSGTITLVARPDALDPQKVGGYVFPRDVYTPRAEQFQEMAAKGVRPGRRELIMGEDALPDTPAHALSMQLAPRFRSYDAFERSPNGAEVLSGGMHPTDLHNLQTAWQSDLYHTLQQQMGHRLPRDLGDGAEQFLEAMRQEAKAGMLTKGERAAYSDFIQNYRRIPSEYAEQKVLKDVPLHGGNWAGAIIRENPELQKRAEDSASNVWGKDIRMAARYTAPDALQNLIKTLTSRGIPAITTRHPEEEYYLAKWLSEQK